MNLALLFLALIAGLCLSGCTTDEMFSVLDQTSKGYNQYRQGAYVPPAAPVLVGYDQFGNPIYR